MTTKLRLTNQDHNNLDVFLGRVLDRHSAGELSRAGAVAVLAQVVGAIDKGNIAEARQWLEEGGNFTDRN